MIKKLVQFFQFARCSIIFIIIGIIGKSIASFYLFLNVDGYLEPLSEAELMKARPAAYAIAGYNGLYFFL